MLRKGKKRGREQGREKRGESEKKEVIEEREGEFKNSEGFCIVCINTVSSQWLVSFQAFVRVPSMKCVCPQKPYTHTGGFPDLFEAGGGGERSSAPGKASQGQS